MIQILRKTGDRTTRFFHKALICDSTGRQYVVVGWCLLAGAAWLTAGLLQDPDWFPRAVVGCYLFLLLAAICAVDGRYGIIPNSMVLALAVGGALQAERYAIWSHAVEAALCFAIASLFRAIYRRLRGQDGLGFGDVKFVAAGTLWVGLEGIPSLLLIAVVSAGISLSILKFEGQDFHRNYAISFGPHLAVGTWWIWVLGS